MTKPFDPQRRSLLYGAAASAAVLGAASDASAAFTPLPQDFKLALRAFESPSAPKPLGFDAASLKGISERLIRSHWENNYAGAVKSLGVLKTRIIDALNNKDMPPYIYNDLKREHLMRTGSVVLHEHYFDNLGGNGQAGAADRKLIGDAFGSFDTWETEFRRIGLGLAGGSGWVVLGYNMHMRQIENYWLGDHAHSPAATLPLLVMDMYEHAYQMDYGAAAAKYIDAFFENIRWEAVSSRIEAARRISQR